MAHYVYKWLESHNELAMVIEDGELQFKCAREGLVSLTKDKFIKYWLKKSDESEDIRFEHEVKVCNIDYIMIEIWDVDQEITFKPQMFYLHKIQK